VRVMHDGSTKFFSVTGPSADGWNR
jgi:hypothetical protein